MDLKSILCFFVAHQDNKKNCREFYFLLQDNGYHVEQVLSDTEILSSWQSFSEYFLFEPELYSENYPVPEKYEDEIDSIESFIQ